jgi:Serine dehydrogenase proteinase
VLVHSPGGLAEAAESIVKILRHKFSDVRFIVPNIAKSAATMLVLSGNSVAMDELSELGPTDPQFSIPRSDGTRTYAPAQAIIDQFDEASITLKGDPALLPAWIPILPSYGPSLYQECKNAIKLSRTLVREWLAKYMFGAMSKTQSLAAARKIANYFANHNNFYTHMRRVDVDKALELGLAVHDMCLDSVLQSQVHDVYRALAFTFENTGAFKIVENSLAAGRPAGNCYVRAVQAVQIQVPIGALQRPA